MCVWQGGILRLERKTVEYKDFEKALARLQEIVGLLEKGELSLEEALGLFEEGVQISRYCSIRLEEAERKVEILLKDDRGQMREQPFEGEAVD